MEYNNEIIANFDDCNSIDNENWFLVTIQEVCQLSWSDQWDTSLWVKKKIQI